MQAGKKIPPVRLQKFLSMAGVCSRRKAEQYILDGRVTVNGRLVDRLGTKVDPGTDRVAFDGQEIRHDGRYLYLALNKPKGYVTSCHQAGVPVVTDLVDVGRRVYPVGRLDKDTTGLLLLTNDGRLHHRLSHPSFDHEKEYLVKVDRPIADKALTRLAGGVVIQGRRTRPAKVERISGRRFRITLQEGRNRQIRRMVRKVGCRVVALKRIRIASVLLGDLAEGKWRWLSNEELGGLLDQMDAGPGGG